MKTLSYIRNRSIYVIFVYYAAPVKRGIYLGCIFVHRNRVVYFNASPSPEV